MLLSEGKRLSLQAVELAQVYNLFEASFALNRVNEGPVRVGGYS